MQGDLSNTYTSSLLMMMICTFKIESNGCQLGIKKIGDQLGKHLS